MVSGDQRLGSVWAVRALGVKIQDYLIWIKAGTKLKVVLVALDGNNTAERLHYLLSVCNGLWLNVSTQRKHSMRAGLIRASALGWQMLTN